MAAEDRALRERTAAEDRESRERTAAEDRALRERLEKLNLEYRAAASEEDRAFQERMAKQRMAFEYRMSRENMEFAAAKILAEHKARMEEQESSFQRQLQLEEFKLFLQTWPLATTPTVLRSSQKMDDGTAKLRVMITSNDQWVTKNILPSTRRLVKRIVSAYGTDFGSQNLILTDGKLRNPDEGGASVESIQHALGNLPVMVLNFNVEEEDKIDIDVKMWGLGQGSSACGFTLATLSLDKDSAEAAGALKGVAPGRVRAGGRPRAGGRRPHLPERRRGGEVLQERQGSHLQATGHAKKRGAYVNGETGACWWWLRSPGGDGGEFAASVYPDGWVDSYGDLVGDSIDAVRPALKLNL